MKKKRVTSKRSSRAAEKNRTSGKTEEKLPKKNRDSSRPSLPRNSARPHPDASRNRDLEDKYRLIFQHSPIGIVHFDRTGQVTDCNDRFVEIIGAPRKDVLAFSLVRSLKDPQMKEAAAAALRGERGYFVGDYASALSGKRMTVKVVFGPSVSNDGSVTGGIGIFEDITVRKAIETALREEKNKSEAIIAAMGDGISVLDLDFKIVYQNDVHKKLMGDHIGEHCYRAYQRKERVCDACPIALAFQDGKTHTVERSGPGEDGTIHVEVAASPLRDASGTIIAGIEAVRDITSRKKAEEETRKTSALLQTLLQSIPDLAYFKDREGRFVFINKVFEQVMNVKASEVIGKTGMEALPAGLAEAAVETDQRVLTEGTTYHGEPTMRRGAETVIFDTIKAPIRDDEGRIIGLVGVTRDITVRKRIEQALRESEERFRMLFENAPDAGFLADIETGRIVDANPAACRLLGRSRDQIIGLHQAELHPPRFRTWAKDSFREHFRQAQESGATDPIEGLVLRAAGTEVPIEVASQRIILDGRPVLYGVFRDVTKRKQAEDALRESEKRYRDLFENANDPIFILDANQRYVDVNRSAVEVYGYSKDEFLAMSVFDLIPPEQVERSKAEFRKLAESGKYEKFIGKTRAKDGRWLTIEVSSSAIMKDGKVIGSRDIVRDITERVRRAKDLERSKDLLAKAEKIAHLGSWEWDIATNALTWSDEVYRLYGMTPGRDQPTFDTVVDTLHADCRGRFLRSVNESVATGQPFEDEYCLIRRDGSIRFTYTKGEIIRDQSGKPEKMLGVVQDITDRKQAEAFVRNILETVDEGFIVIDRNYRILSANKAYCNQAGRPSEEIIGRKCYEISHGLSQPCFEVGEACAVRRTFETGEPAAELHTHYDDKKNPIYVEIKSFPVKDAMGKMTAAIEIVNNMTEKKKLEDQLRHAQKMEAVGLLAGGVAHDFNNILTAIMGYGNLLEMKLPQDDPLRMYTDQILASSARAANLTQSLLAFSRKQVINPRPVDMNEIIVRVEKLLRRVIGEDIELRTDLKPGALTIVADASQIEQVLMNLATNARDAMPEGGTLTIKTGSAEIDEAAWKASGFGRGGAYVTVAVSDTGVGMDEKTRQRIFEPFYTTKELGRGTGLGLAIVYGIMKQNNGYVTVTSEVGKGSSFKLYFPLTGASAEQEPQAVPIRGMRRGSGTVLLAEDDSAVRQLIRNTLSEFGYTVIDAVDGEDAVGKFMEHRDRIQLLILDVIMPNKNGREAYHAIRAVRPDIPTIFMSGYSDDIISRRVLVDDRCHFIAKPVTPQYLLEKVQSILT